MLMTDEVYLIKITGTDNSILEVKGAIFNTPF